jgi:hypothetical protein
MTAPFSPASDRPTPTPRHRMTLLSLHDGARWFFYCACGDVGPARDASATAFYDWEDQRAVCVLRPAADGGAH